MILSFNNMSKLPFKNQGQENNMTSHCSIPCQVAMPHQIIAPSRHFHQLQDVFAVEIDCDQRSFFDAMA